jgi:hypothetical protein
MELEAGVTGFTSGSRGDIQRKYVIREKSNNNNNNNTIKKIHR